MGKSEGKRPLGRPSITWKDSIKTDFEEIGWGVECIAAAQNRDKWWNCCEYCNTYLLTYLLHGAESFLRS